MSGLERSWDAFLKELIERSLQRVHSSFHLGSIQLQGSLEGLEACKGKSIEETLELYRQAKSFLDSATGEVLFNNSENEEHLIRYQSWLQIQWVLNVAAARDVILRQESFNWLPEHPSYRAVEEATSIYVELDRNQ